MTLKRILAIVVFLLGWSTLGWAQATTQGNLTVRSNPPGAQAILNGDAIVSGITPVQFRHLLVGDYKLTVKKYGFENYSTRLVLDPGKPLSVDIRLVPKTRLKAAARSFFIPGWGQKYTSQNKKAFLLAGLAVGAGIGYYFADNHFDEKYEIYENRLAERDSVATHGNISELRSLQAGLDKAQNEAYDAENMRRATIGVAIGVWVVSLIDVLFFFPEERGIFSAKGLTLEPTAGTNHVGLAITAGF